MSVQSRYDIVRTGCDDVVNSPSVVLQPSVIDAIAAFLSLSAPPATEVAISQVYSSVAGISRHQNESLEYGNDRSPRGVRNEFRVHSRTQEKI